MSALATMPARSDWVTVGRAARQLGVSPTTIRRLILSGRLTSRSVPYAWERVLRSDLEALARASTKERVS
jgi:excisionase family DNA binding protein